MKKSSIGWVHEQCVDVAPAGDIEAWIGGSHSSPETETGSESGNSPDTLPRVSMGRGLSVPGSSPNVCMPAGLKLAFSSSSRKRKPEPSAFAAQCTQESASTQQLPSALSRHSAISDDELIAGLDVEALLLDAAAQGTAPCRGAQRPQRADLLDCIDFEKDIRASSALLGSRFVLRGLPVARSALSPGCELLWLLCCAEDPALRGLPSVEAISPSLCTVPVVLSAGWTVPAWSLRRACVHVVFIHAAGGDSAKRTQHTHFGEALHLCGDFGLLVVYPEKLLSPSALTGGMDCARRPVLKSKLPSGPQAPAALQGTLKHEMFESLVQQAAAAVPDAAGVQDALMFLAADAAELAASICSSPDTLLAAEACGLTQQQLSSSLEACIPSILSFIEAHVFGAGGRGWRLRRVLQTEEEMHCAVLGLKGIVDMVATIATEDGRLACVPVELKTGKLPKSMRPEHRAQVALYSLLLASHKAVTLESGMLDSKNVLFSLKAGGEANCGILLHVRSDSPAFQADMVPHSWQEMRSLAQLRNEMAATFHPLFPALNEFGVPERDVPASVCDMCFEREQCGKLQAVEAARAPAPAAATEPQIPQRWDSLYAYVRHFWSLLQQETVATQRRSGQGSEARRGTAAQHTLLTDDACTLTLQSVLQTSASGFSVVLHAPAGVSCPVREGDTALLLAAGRPSSSAMRGRVHAICDGVVHFHTQHDPRRSTLLAASLVQPSTGVDKQPTLAASRWRLQRQEFSTGTRIAHGAFVALHERKGSLADVLCGKQAPSFAASAPVGAASDAQWLTGLNPEQQHAVRKCMQAQDVAIIQGMPGAGKSTTTTALCLGLLGQGRRVLLASHTNAAVDALLGKLAAQPDFKQYSGARLGQKGKVAATLHEFCRGGAAAAGSISAANWVAGTAHTACSAHTGSFDVVIIDEASQLTEPATLALALLGSTVVLVGDHLQIAPLVHSDAAAAGGLAVSMMQRLAELWPQCLTKLCTQYRMTAGLQQVSNLFAYDGEMRCGLPVREQAAAPAAPGQTRFEHRVLSNSDEVVFVDVPEAASSTAGAGQSSSSSRLHECPIGAAALVHAVIQLLGQGHAASDIAVICALRKHVSFYERAFPAELKPRVGSIDTFQGQEAAFVMVDGFERKASLLLDMRRLNVACTRAKQKLVFFCHSSSLWAGPLGAVRSQAQQWLMQLPQPYASTETAVCEAIEHGGVPQLAAWSAILARVRAGRRGTQRGAKQARRA